MISAPGLQGSETSSVIVRAYSRPDDPILTAPPASTFRGGSADAAGDEPSVTFVSTSKRLGVAAGSFTVVLKFPPGATNQDFVDDDWIDISFVRHGVEYHTMRGLIEVITKSETLGGNGATVTSVTLQGSDFGCIFTKTTVWYNYVKGEDNTLHLLDVFNLDAAIRGHPSEVVEKILFGFMQAQQTAGRANWLLPANMPGAAATFPETVYYDDARFSNSPNRDCVGSLSTGDPQPIWDLAQEYSDPMFCDIICDLGNVLSPAADLEVSRGYTPLETQMRVQFRDKVFPTVSAGGGGLGLGASGGLRSEWFNLPTTKLALQELASIEVTRSTHDRYNAFMVSPNVVETGGATGDIIGPLWDEADVRKHGLRQFDVQSRFFATGGSLFNMAEEQRETIRDWHAIGPYLLNGGVVSQRVVPETRVGTRLRIPGDSEDKNRTFYVEGVDHEWSLPKGGKTSFQVTRGWQGTDRSLIQAITTLAARYTLGRV